MSTRGHVGIKENGKYTYIYNHHDSYIHGLGITLYQHYKDVDKVRELIAFGNTSSIGSTVEVVNVVNWEMENPLKRNIFLMFLERISHTFSM